METENQPTSQASLVTKNGMGPAMVRCQCDLYTAGCGHCGPLGDVGESTWKRYTHRALSSRKEMCILLTVPGDPGGSDWDR